MEQFHVCSGVCKMRAHMMPVAVSLQTTAHIPATHSAPPTPPTKPSHCPCILIQSAARHHCVGAPPRRFLKRDCARTSLFRSTTVMCSPLLNAICQSIKHCAARQRETRQHTVSLPATRALKCGTRYAREHARRELNFKLTRQDGAQTMAMVGPPT